MHMETQFNWKKHLLLYKRRVRNQDMAKECLSLVILSKLYVYDTFMQIMQITHICQWKTHTKNLSSIIYFSSNVPLFSRKRNL